MMDDTITPTNEERIKEGYPSLQWCETRKNMVDDTLNSLLKERAEIDKHVMELMHESRTFRMQIRLHMKEYGDND